MTAKLQAFYLENRIIPDPAVENDSDPDVQWHLGFRQTLVYHFSVRKFCITITHALKPMISGLVKDFSSIYTEKLSSKMLSKMDSPRVLYSDSLLEVGAIFKLGSKCRVFGYILN
jgi:hypothetical protein